MADTTLFATLRESWRQVLSDSDHADGRLPAFLLALTLVTGLVDAFSYLVLGHVFVANMTGNLVFLGFALAGASDFSIAASLVALATFVVGAAIGGRLSRSTGAERTRLFATAALVEAGLIGAAVLMMGFGDPAAGGVRNDLIAILALAMGLQNATARSLAVPDLATTVLTLTITGLAADGRLGAGGTARSGRRAMAIGSMFVGAVVGAVLTVDGLAGLVLVLALTVTGGFATFAFHGLPDSRAGSARTRRPGADAAATPAVRLVRSQVA